MSECIFCKIARRESPAEIIAEWENAIAFVPLNPVIEGHILVIPKKHTHDFVECPMTSSITMMHAAELAGMLAHQDYNVITSKGPSATQSIGHLHLHLVPRKENDGLSLPWTGQRI